MGRNSFLEYIWAVILGILYGGFVGVCKYLFLWRKILHPKDDWELTTKRMYTRMFLSMAINTATLLLVYFVRNLLPVDFVTLAIATALALSLSGRAYSIHKIQSKAKGL
jgi:hypothetical protein